MKTKSTLIAMLAFAALSDNMQAQVLYKETFSGLTLSTINSVSCANVPSNMVITNVGNKVADASTNNRPFNASPFTTTAWVASAITVVNPDTAARSTSWFSPVSTADKWLISPVITGLTASSALSWEGFAPDAQFADGYEVWVSAQAGATTTPVPADFTGNSSNRVFNIASESSTGWAAHGVSLSAFAGQTVRVAFRNNSNDKFHLYIDDILVMGTVNAKEASVTKAATTQVILGPSGGNVNISATLTNLGLNTMTNAGLKCRVDNGTPTPQSVSPNLAYTGSTTVTFNNINVTGVGAHTIKVWVDDINTSGPDGNALNDTATVMVYVASQTVPRKVLYEGFSSSTCGPCATANPALHTLLLNNGANSATGKVAAVKYQMNYPSPGNDPAYTAEATTRHNLYQVAGIPHGVLNGSAWSDHPANLNQGIIDAEYNKPTAWEFINMAFNPAGSTVTGDLKSYVDLNNTSGDLKLYCAFVEDKITSTDGAHGVQSNGETTWYEVMRKMVPSTSGTTLPNQTNGGTTPINLTFAFTGTPKVFTSTNLMTAVLWVQSSTDNYVFQAGVVGNATAINDAESKLSTLDVYPNPTNSDAAVKFTLKNNEKVTISVYNMMGELVSSQDLGDLQAGTHNTAISASSLAAGLYHVSITAGGQTTTRKLAVQK